MGFESNFSAIIEVLKYCIPSLIVGGVAYLFLYNFFKREELHLRYKSAQSQGKEVLPIRLQAYERLTIFLERIAPNSLVMRLQSPDLTAQDMQFVLLTNIKQEFEHNLAQQLYVSSSAWQMINITKDQTIRDINLVASQQPNGASGKDLSRAILQYYIEQEEATPTQKCIEILKKEFLEVFG